MKFPRWIYPFVVSFFLSLVPGHIAGQTPARKPLHLIYKLTLQQCHGNSCNDKIAAIGQVKLHFEAETPTLGWGYEGVERKVGDVMYYLRFLGSCDTKKKNGLTISVSFAGREGAPPNDRQITWGSKKAAAHEWPLVPHVIAMGDSYTDGQDVVTPRLEVRIITQQ